MRFKRHLVVSFLLGVLLSCKSVPTESDSNALSEEVAGGAAQSSHRFDIIDTSFLLPFPEEGGLVIKASGDSVTTATGKVESVLMSEAQFARLPSSFHQHLGKNLSANDLLDKLYITGFRYDPCFPIVTPDLDPNGAGCRLRAIRLVGQFIDFKSKKAEPSSMHILFVVKNPDPKLDVATNNAIIGGLKKLRASAGIPTSGTPLGVHPGFYGPNAEDFAKEVKALILTFASQKNFFATSVFFQSPPSTANDTTTWNWAQFLMQPVSANSPQTRHLVLDPTTGLKSGIKRDFSTFVVDNKGVANFPDGSDLRDVQDATNPLFFPIPRLATLLDMNASKTELAHGIAAADIFENPTKMTIPAGDCASCHVATQRRLNRLEAAGDQVNRQFAFQPPSGITSSMDPAVGKTMRSKAGQQTGSNIVINFGYHGNKPVISQRTVNEAIQVTHLINEKMLDGNW